jgi:hypothetical protein
MALRKRIPEQDAREIELLLPWHAVGALNPREANRVREALAGDRELSRQYAEIAEECADTVQLNEELGAPSPRALLKLFAVIDAEPARLSPAKVTLNSRVLGFFASGAVRAQ